MNAGGRYFVDIVFDKQPDGTPSSHVLVDSVREPRSLCSTQKTPVCTVLVSFPDGSDSTDRVRAGFLL